MDFRGLLQHFHFVEHFLPAFGPADGFFAVKGFEAGDDFFLMADFLLLVQIGLHLRFPKLRFLPRVVRIVSRECSDGSLIDLHNLRDDPVQKVPVVGDDDDGPLIVHEEGFQPGDGMHVQMVGGLVQQDDIRAGEEQLPEGDSRLLSAGQSVHLFVKFRFFKAQSFEDAGDLAFPCVAVLLFKLMAEPCVGVHQLRERLSLGVLHGAFRLPHLRFQGQDLLLDRQKFVENAAAARHLLMLRQIADAFSAGDNGLSFIRRQLLHDDFQQRGFARAVDADNGRLFPLLYMKRGIPKHNVIPECLCNVLTC